MNIIHRTDSIFKDSLIQLYKLYKQPDSIGTAIERNQKHSHEFMQIWYIVQGVCSHIVEDVRYQMPTKSLLVIPPYVMHSFENESNDINIIGCEFPIEIVTEDITLHKINKKNLLEFTYKEVFETAVLQAKPCYVPGLQCQIQIEMLLEGMLKEYSEKNSYYQICLKSDLLKFLTCLARDYEANPTSIKMSKNYKTYVNYALDYMKENYQNKLYLKDVAKNALMSESYFSYFFREVTGQTFVEYLNYLRIEKAKELLKNSDMSVSQIGYAVGFNEMTYFTKVFKKEVKCTPAEYKKLSRSAY